MNISRGGLLKPTRQNSVDSELSRKFDTEIKANVPHLLARKDGSVIANGTPLVDITDALLECGRVEYGIRIPVQNMKVYG